MKNVMKKAICFLTGHTYTYNKTKGDAITGTVTKYNLVCKCCGKPFDNKKEVLN